MNIFVTENMFDKTLEAIEITLEINVSEFTILF